MRLYLAIILAISLLENFKVHIIRGTLATQALPHNSCISLRTKKIGIRQLSDYEIHHYPQKVVILITKNRVKVCVPHDASWVHNAIRHLDERKRKTRDLKRTYVDLNNQANRTTTRI